MPDFHTIIDIPKQDKTKLTTESEILHIEKYARFSQHITMWIKPEWNRGWRATLTVSVRRYKEITNWNHRYNLRKSKHSACYLGVGSGWRERFDDCTLGASHVQWLWATARYIPQSYLLIRSCAKEPMVAVHVKVSAWGGKTMEYWQLIRYISKTRYK